MKNFVSFAHILWITHWFIIHSSKVTPSFFLKKHVTLWQTINQQELCRIAYIPCLALEKMTHNWTHITFFFSLKTARQTCLLLLMLAAFVLGEVLEVQSSNANPSQLVAAGNCSPPALPCFGRTLDTGHRNHWQGPRGEEDRGWDVYDIK